MQFLKLKIKEIYENNEDELNLLKEKYESEIFELNKKWNSEVNMFFYINCLTIAEK